MLSCLVGTGLWCHGRHVGVRIDSAMKVVVHLPVIN